MLVYFLKQAKQKPVLTYSFNFNKYSTSPLQFTVKPFESDPNTDNAKNAIKGLELLREKTGSPNYNRAKLVPFSTTKMELVDKYSFEMRDLRSLQISSASSSKYAAPTFFVRNHAFIVHLTHMSALISADNCYLFNCSARIPQSNREKDDDIYNDYMLERFCTKYTKSVLQKSVSHPFQFHCLEAVFKAVVSKHRLLLNDVDKECQKSLEEVEKNALEMVNNVTSLKIKLIQCLTETKALVDAFHELLNNKYDMNLMYLPSENDSRDISSSASSVIYGSTNVSSNDKQLEFLLENYLWQFDEILDRFQLLSDEIQMVERSMGYKMNQQRNEIIKMNLKLSVITCGFSVGAVTASIFGMNLVSHLEVNPYFFYVVLPFATAIVPYSVWQYFKKQFPF